MTSGRSSLDAEERRRDILRIRLDERGGERKVSVGLRGRVARALRRLRAAQRSVIHIDAKDRRVTLRGIVPSPRARLELCAVAGEVDGVERVENELRIT